VGKGIGLEMRAAPAQQDAEKEVVGILTGKKAGELKIVVSAKGNEAAGRSNRTGIRGLQETMI